MVSDSESETQVVLTVAGKIISESSFVPFHGDLSDSLAKAEIENFTEHRASRSEFESSNRFTNFPSLWA